MSAPERLARVGVVGSAGLGGAALITAETLARAGVESLVIDPDAAALGRAFTAFARARGGPLARAWRRVRRAGHAWIARGASEPRDPRDPRARVTASTDGAALVACELVLVLSDEAEVPPSVRARALTMSPPTREDAPCAMPAMDEMHASIALLPSARAPAILEQVEPAAHAAHADFAEALARALSVPCVRTAGFALPARRAWLLEAMRLADEGVAPRAIDHALLEAGWAAAPTATLATMGEELGWPNVERWLGRATIGTRGDARVAPEDIQQRVAIAFVGEALRALEHDPRDPRDAHDTRGARVRDADLLAVRGLGFPAALGGPFRWLDALGADEASRRFATHEARFGARFALPAGLARARGAKLRFHG